MVELLILWGYMLLVNGCIGAGVLKGFSGLSRRLASGGRKGKTSINDKEKDSLGFPFGMAAVLLAGVVAITVYAQVFSLFGRVSAAAHLLLIVFAAVAAYWCRAELLAAWKRYRRILLSWEGVLYLSFAVMTAYFASRGLQHTDTGIYHAQMIRWYEEYGIVPGLANLQQHFGYNSAYLAYAAMFSMKWLLGQSLHGTTGFFQAFLVIWALYGLKSFQSHKSHLADGCRAAILLYAIVVSERIMSPATDFGAMYLVFWIVCLWTKTACEREAGKEEKTELYALLCVAVVCVTTYKLSAGMLVLLALYPAILLIRQKEWKRIGLYVAAGLAVLIPWLVRNVVLTGWLIYPFEAVNLFSVDWKVPLELMQHDADQIKAWGRCLYDAGRIGEPISAWLPVWWGEKDRHEIMLLAANGIAVLLTAAAAVYRLICRKKYEWDRVILYAAVLAGIAGWFFTAPFIRYGLAFLLILPCMAVGEWLRPVKMGPVRILSGFGAAAVFFSMSMYWDYYVLFDLVWVKQHLTDPAWVIQQDYDRVETGEMEVEGGLTVFYPLEGDNISYHAFPGTAYKTMAETCRMRGSSVRDGFMPK